MAWLLGALREAGAAGQVTTLLARDPAAQVSPPSMPTAWAGCCARWTRRGRGQVTALASRASLDTPVRVANLVDAFRMAGAHRQISAVLARDPAADVSLDDPDAVAWLLGALDGAGAAGQVTTLLARDPVAQVSLDDPGGVARLLEALRAAGATGQPPRCWPATLPPTSASMTRPGLPGC